MNDADPGARRRRTCGVAACASHPDFHRRSWSSTRSTVRRPSRTSTGSRTVTAGSDLHRPRSTRAFACGVSVARPWPGGRAPQRWWLTTSGWPTTMKRRPGAMALPRAVARPLWLTTGGLPTTMRRRPGAVGMPRVVARPPTAGRAGGAAALASAVSRPVTPAGAPRARRGGRQLRRPWCRPWAYAPPPSPSAWPRRRCRRHDRPASTASARDPRGNPWPRRTDSGRRQPPVDARCHRSRTTLGTRRVRRPAANGCLWTKARLAAAVDGLAVSRSRLRAAPGRLRPGRLRRTPRTRRRTHPRRPRRTARWSPGRRRRRPATRPRRRSCR